MRFLWSLIWFYLLNRFFLIWNVIILNLRILLLCFWLFDFFFLSIFILSISIARLWIFINFFIRIYCICWLSFHFRNVHVLHRRLKQLAWISHYNIAYCAWGNTVYNIINCTYSTNLTKRFPSWTSQTSKISYNYTCLSSWNQTWRCGWWNIDLIITNSVRLLSISLSSPTSSSWLNNWLTP